MASVLIKSAGAKATVERVKAALTPEAQDQLIQLEAAKTLADLVKATPQKWSLSGARQSWAMEKLSNAVYRIFNPNKVMRFLEDGTKAHGPVKAKALFIPLTKKAALADRSTFQRGKVRALVAQAIKGRKKVYADLPGVLTPGKSSRNGFGQNGLVYGLDYILVKWVKGITALHIVAKQRVASRARLLLSMKGFIRKAVRG